MPTTPSFSSFPPSFSSFPVLDPEPNKPSSSAEPAQRRKRSRSPNHDKKKHRRSNKGKERDRDREHKSKSKSKSKQDHENSYKADGSLQPVQDEASKYFYSDRRGDPMNVQYGGLHAGDVPKYHAVARGRFVLGLPRGWAVTQRTGKSVVIDLVGTHKLSGLTDSRARALLQAPPVRRLVYRETSKYEEDDGVIRITSRRRDTYKAHELTAENLLHPDYDESSSSSDELREDSEDSSEDEDKIERTAHQEALAELNRNLTEDPTNEALWLQLLDKNLSTIPLNSKNATKARAEVTLSIIERARAACRQNQLSKILLIKFLKAGEDVWEPHRSRDEWERAYGTGGIEIWMEWLEWRWRTSSQGIDGFIEDGIRVLKSLGTDTGADLSRIRVLWRLAVALQGAGFHERATALFQAQAELTFKSPEALSGSPHQTQLDTLQEFWESGYPRVGETDAKGWAAWFSTGKSEFTGSQATSVLQPDQHPDSYTAWANFELRADMSHHIPIRSPDDQPTNTDPYTTILFGDISPLLVVLRSNQAKHLFRLVWLSVLGLHVPGLSLLLSGDGLNWDDRWSLGHLAKSSYLDIFFPKEATGTHLTNDAVAGAIIGRAKEYAGSFSSIRNWSKDALSPLDVGLRDEGLGKQFGKPSGCIWGKEDVENVDIEFVRQIFRQLRVGINDAEWDCLALAFETVINLKQASRASRELLKTASESAVHWATHAHIERMRGRIEDARKVYQTVLVHSNVNAAQYRGQMWWDWAEMEWLAGGDADALAIVLKSVGMSGKGGPVILRATRLLEEAVENTGEEHWKEREAWVKLRALLEVVGSSSVSRCLSVMERYRATGSKAARESMTVASLMMIHRYATVRNHPLRREILRSNAEQALEEFPSNSAMLGLFLEGEKGLGIWGRVRSELGDSKGRIKDTARRVQEVWIAGWERSRWSAEVERTRNGLAAATASERTRGSATLWRIYIEFELRAGQPQRAKQLLFMAIRECPLWKELYLIAFTSLRSVFTARELGGLAETMAERGLRLRQDPEGVWKTEEEQRSSEGESDGEMDEIEERARETRRLMPY
ncbi:hypothetical protein AX16_006478 [Volvariella volvacea WC 439]|nr:hypothetical protein AX16_006478 [Volvariella volvacea WC 439]